jgi:hypothetical protein
MSCSSPRRKPARESYRNAPHALDPKRRAGRFYLPFEPEQVSVERQEHEITTAGTQDTEGPRRKTTDHFKFEDFKFEDFKFKDLRSSPA